MPSDAPSRVPSEAPSPPPPTTEPTQQFDRPLNCVQTKSGSELTIQHSSRFYKGDVHCLSTGGQEAFFGHTWTNQFGLFVNGESVWEIPHQDVVSSVFRWSFQGDGNLVIRDENDIVLWMTGSSCCSSGSGLKVSMERVWIESRSGSQLWSEPLYVTPSPSPPPPPTCPATARPDPDPTPRPNPPSTNGSTVSYVPGKLTKTQNGLLLRRRLSSRIVTRTSQKVPLSDGSTSGDRFHGEPDGTAVFADPDTGGWWWWGWCPLLQ